MFLLQLVSSRIFYWKGSSEASYRLVPSPSSRAGMYTSHGTGTFLHQKRGTGNEATPKLGSFPTWSTLPSFTFTLNHQYSSHMQILGGGESSVVWVGSFPSPPLDETLSTHVTGISSTSRIPVLSTHLK